MLLVSVSRHKRRQGKLPVSSLLNRRHATHDDPPPTITKLHQARTRPAIRPSRNQSIAHVVDQRLVTSEHPPEAPPPEAEPSSPEGLWRSKISPWLDGDGARLVTLLTLAGALVTLGSWLILNAVRPDEPAPVEEALPQADEALEVVDVDFGMEPVAVPIDEASLPGNATAQSTISGGQQPERLDDAPAREVIVTLRNNTDDTAVLTAIRVDVHRSEFVSDCLFAGGGAIIPSFTYEFTFPVGSEPWTRTDDQNFAVDPRSADALSVVVGPSARNILDGIAYTYTITAVSAAGREARWVDVLGTNWLMTLEEAAQLSDFAVTAVDSGNPEIRSRRDAVACAQRSLRELEDLQSSLSDDGRTLVDPGFLAHLSYYEQLIEKLGEQ